MQERAPIQPDDCFAPLPPAALRGLQLFNVGEFFEAHEALEDAWREERGPIRVLYQAILQVAVTYLHIQHGNYEGGLQLSERARLKLELWPDTCRGVDIACLRHDLALVVETLTRLGPAHISAFNQGLFKAVRYQEK